MTTKQTVSLRGLLFDGLTDAAGCLAGALLGLAVGQLLGLPLPAGSFSDSGLIGIGLIVLGASIGVRMARRRRSAWRRTRAADSMQRPHDPESRQ
ncbi:MAG: hypothetical protein LH479_06920 [Polaromonas sp.]|nr:hypothetical protein [Polaromonas sp.]